MSLGSSGAERNQVLTSTSRQSKKSKWVLHNSKTVILFVWLLFKFDTPSAQKTKNWPLQNFTTSVSEGHVQAGGV